MGKKYFLLPRRHQVTKESVNFFLGGFVAWWLHLGRIKLRIWYIVLVVPLLGLILSACNLHTERPPNADRLYIHGQEIYVEYCAECHQMDGMGWLKLYPRLADNPIVTLDDPEPIILTVMYGQGSMTGFRDKLNSDDVGAVLTYIRNSWGNKAPAVSPRQVY